MTDFVEQGALQADRLRARRDRGELLRQYGIELGTRRRTQLYGLVFKAANKSTVWYNVPAFEDAGVEPPATWDELARRARDR